LRTPLNAVIGYSEILLEDAQAHGNDGQMADLKRINSAGRHLLSLLTNVFDIAKIDSDDIELTVTRFDFGGFIDDVVSTCRRLVERNGNKLIVQSGADLGFVSSDETRLRQVVINLLSNAGKFTTNGRVFLRVRREKTALGEEIVIAVEDTGIGISPKNLERLFTNFNQAEASTARKYGGTGLGLALSRNLCRLMGGDIEVTSEVGKGSIFTIRAPADSNELVHRKPRQAAAAA